MEHKTSVSPEDQQKINTFARLFDREQQLEAETKALKNQIAGFEDAELELLEIDEPKIPVKFGEIFISTKSDDVSDLIEKRLEEAKLKKNHVDTEMEHIRKQMSALRSDLYKTFGDNISLEIDKD